MADRKPANLAEPPEHSEPSEHPGLANPPRNSLVVPKHRRDPDEHGKEIIKPLQTTASRIVQTLDLHGTERVFGIPGGPISPIVDALLDTAIEHITCQHENMAVYAAGAEGLVQQRPGIVAVTSGPGVLNAMTGLAACFHDQMPLILLVGEVATSNQGRGALQDGSESALNISQMVRSICKKSMLIEQPDRAGEDIAEAWRIAIKPPYGPVVVRIPVDIATRTTQCEPAKKRRVPSARRTLHGDRIERIAQLLRTAERPTLLIGGGVCRRRAYKEVLSLAEASRCAVMTDLEAKGAFPESHPLSLGIFGVGGDGRAARYLETGTDLVITLGARLDDTTTANFSPLLQPKDGTMVQVDEDALRLARSYDPDITLAGNLKTIIRAIERRTGAVERPYPRVAPKSAVNHEIGLAPHDPIAAIAALQRSLPKDTVFVSDIGNHLLFASQALTLDSPGCFYASLGLGGMGSGIGTAMGLQAAYGRSRQVVCICGDGSYLMSGNEIATCARYNIPVLFVVVNDGQLGMVQHGAERVYGRSHEWLAPELSVLEHAASVGVESLAFSAVVNDPLYLVSRFGPLTIELPVSPTVKAFNPRDATLYTSEEAPHSTSVELKAPKTRSREVA